MAIKETDIKICGHGSGTPSVKEMYTYLESRYNSKMSNGLRKGVLCVRRLKAMTDTKRTEFHDTYKTILGRNKYSQDLRYYVYTKYDDGKYYSDCSSSGCATYKKIGFKMDLLNTVGILESELFEDVPVKISKGHITNPEILKVGDAILFAGNVSRPWADYCGHVEYVYEMPEAENKNDVTAEEQTNKDDVSYMGLVTATALNVRSGVGTSNPVVTIFSNNKLLSITKEKDGWGFANDIGWLSLKYVKKIVSISGKVTAYALNVRKAEKDGEILKTISNGTKVAIIKLNKDATWGFDSNSNGWVSLKYIAI